MSYAEFPSSCKYENSFEHVIDLLHKMEDTYTLIVNGVRDINMKLKNYMYANNRYVDDKLTQYQNNVNAQFKILSDNMHYLIKSMQVQLNSTVELQNENISDMQKKLSAMQKELDSFVSRLIELETRCNQYAKNLFDNALLEQKSGDDLLHEEILDQVEMLQRQIDKISTTQPADVKNPFADYGYGLDTLNNCIRDLYVMGITGMGFTAQQWSDADFITAEEWQLRSPTALEWYTHGREIFGCINTDHTEEWQEIINKKVGEI